MDRKPKDQTLTVRITKAAKDRLEELARADDRSMASYLERLILQQPKPK
ncbi:MAG: hypothetical protein K2X43_01220 [Hyphomonadaceae bacterium]|jgi:predicted transcriptional regulator|nr:hypothetical protein [Hyphomonadaceae bacterium]